MARDAQIPFDPTIHHRKSIRVEGYDYAQAGAYFVTLVTYQRGCLFGEIIEDEMRLNLFGITADECWRAIPDHFQNVNLGAYVIMPNHVHGIIIIHESVGARHASPLHVSPPSTNPPRGTPPHSLGAIVGSFKSVVTKRIGPEHNATGIWQRNYYEHIIRNDNDLQRITNYINANPLRWNNDSENPRNHA